MHTYFAMINTDLSQKYHSLQEIMDAKALHVP